MAQTEPHATAVAHPGGEAHSAGFPPFDSSTFASQLLWLAISFGLFYWLLSTKVLPRISGILEARADRIARDLAEAEKLKGQTEAAIAGYEQSLAEARRKAQGIAAETRTSLNAAVEAKRQSAEAALSGKLAEAETRIADIKARAMGEVGSIAADAAEAVVTALSGVAVERAEVTAAVDAALAN